MEDSEKKVPDLPENPGGIADPETPAAPAEKQDPPPGEEEAVEIEIGGTLAEDEEEASAEKAEDAPPAVPDSPEGTAPGKDSDAPPAAPESPEEPAPAKGEDPAPAEKPPEDIPPQAKKPARKQPDLEPIDFSATDREYVEKAADPKEYRVYEKQEARLPGGAGLKLFAASRIGLGHLQKNTACQDSCLYRVIPQGVVLTDADGISACPRSDVGSRLACEIAADAVEEAGKQDPEEAAFIRRLCSAEFYSGLREKWLAAVLDHWEKNPDGADGKLAPKAHYGTTLLIAVLTDNWVVTLNLGDGQILLFNELECMKTQLVDKESQAPCSLIYDEYLEDVRRGVWPRKAYQGVLLMSDGMNDRLSKLPAYPCHDYAVQAMKRFLENDEPKQPFILTAEIKGDLRTYDVSRQRNASDDFSVVMAVNTDFDPAEAESMIASVREHIPGAAEVQLLRRTGSKVSYLVRKESRYSVVLTVPEKELAAADPDIDVAGVQKWQESLRWQEAGRSFAEYLLPLEYASLFLEECTQEFAFKSAAQYHKIPDSFDPVTLGPRYTVEPLVGQGTVLLLLQLQELSAGLKAAGLKLNEMAFPWILRVKDSDRTLLVPREVFSDAGAPDPSQPWVPGPDQLAPGLLGYLGRDDELMAVYSPGAVKENRQFIYYLFGAGGGDPDASPFFTVIHNEKTGMYGLRNISGYPWQVSAGNPEDPDKTIEPGNIASFAEGRRIRVMKRNRILCECVMHVL